MRACDALNSADEDVSHSLGVTERLPARGVGRLQRECPCDGGTSHLESLRQQRRRGRRDLNSRYLNPILLNKSKTISRAFAAVPNHDTRLAAMVEHVQGGYLLNLGMAHINQATVYLITKVNY